MKLLKSPLFHFCVLGVVLFALWSLRGAPLEEPDAIVVTAAEVRQLAETWTMQWNRPPTDEELDGLIDQYIREEVFYREALAMGLDSNDRVIRRRLAQRIEFLAEDLASQGEPAPAELRAWFDENRDRYRMPARLSFTHVYVSTDKRGETADEDAKRILAELRKEPEDPEPWLRGDGFMLAMEFRGITVDELDRLFGGELADGVDSLELGSWQGPVRSGYGLHLVRVHERSEARVPSLEEVRESVLQDFRAQKRREANDALYERLRARYRIEVEPFPPEVE